MTDFSNPQMSAGQRRPGLRAANWRWREEAVGVVMVGFVGLVMVAVLPHLLPGTVLVHLDQGRLHAGVGFLLCALVLFALRARIRALLSALAGVSLLASIGLFAAGSFAAMSPDKRPDFTLISFNVLGFNPRGAEIAAYFAGQAPDVALVLEAPALHEHLDAMHAAFPYSAGCGEGLHCDMAIFSRHPIRSAQIMPFFTIHGRLIRAQIEIADESVTLLAAHLTKPYYGNWHSQQMDRLVETLAEIEGPVVLAGDFNSQAFVRAFHDHLIGEADMRLASRLQPTWPALSSFPLSMAGFAIDHVLVRGALAPVEVRLIEDPIGSNHRGLFSAFDLDGR